MDGGMRELSFCSERSSISVSLVASHARTEDVTKERWFMVIELILKVGRQKLHGASINDAGSVDVNFTTERSGPEAISQAGPASLLWISVGEFILPAVLKLKVASSVSIFS